MIGFIYTRIQIDAILVLSPLISLLKLFEQGITNIFIYLSLPLKSAVIGKLGRGGDGLHRYFSLSTEISLFNLELYMH